MDYKKKYKEALERAKGIHSFSSDIAEIKRMEQIFPELAESEDERIRKAQLDYWRSVGGKEWHGVPVQETIAWLEKQGQVKESEPKYNVGDWIVWKDKCYKVNDNGCGYELIDTNGLSTSLEYGTVDENAHLWTIEDAKNGDVLVCENGWTCIFKALDNHTNTFSSYCFMDKDKWFCNTGSECHTLDKAFIEAYNEEIYPATKAQREQLFKAMHEAGYEWNEKNKELNKIETLSNSWTEEDECYIGECISAVATKDGWSFDEKRKTKHWLKSLKQRMEQ